MSRLILPLALLLASCGGDDNKRQKPPVNGWSVVENVQGKSVAQGVTLEPSGDLWSATIRPGAELDGVSKPTRAITPGATVRIRYRVTGEGLYPAEAPGADPILTIMVQRYGDDWSAKGERVDYRQYVTATTLPLTPGEHDATITLAHPCCTNVYGQYGALDQTLAGAQRIWLAFGHWDGRMHGVQSRTPVTFELLEWSVS